MKFSKYIENQLPELAMNKTTIANNDARIVL